MNLVLPFLRLPKVVVVSPFGRRASGGGGRVGDAEDSEDSAEAAMSVQ